MKEYHLNVNGHDYKLTLKHISGERAEVEVDGKTYSVDIHSIQQKGKPRRRELARQMAAQPLSTPQSTPQVALTPNTGANAITAPIPGAILEVYAKEGESVELGQDLLKMEAMKMENRITAPQKGEVGKIHVKAGDSVSQGQVLIELK